MKMMVVIERNTRDASDVTAGPDARLAGGNDHWSDLV